MRTTPGSFALAFLLFCCPLTAQEGGEAVTLLRFDSGGPSDRVGEAVALAGDINGDGTPDIIVGAEFSNSFGFLRNGSVYVYSGITGGLLHQFHGSADFEKFGSEVASAGDLNLDGFEDILIGSPEASPNGLANAGMIDVFSGADGSNLLHIDGTVAAGYFGRSVSSCGDIDNDGTTDFLVGESGFNNQTGRVHLYSGLTGATLLTIDGTPGSSLGFSVSNAGDLDNDGAEDLLVGSPNASSLGFVENGWATVFSSATGLQLMQLEGQADNVSFGHSVSGGFDVNDDGTPDFIVGAPFVTNPAGFNSAGAASVFSGSNGQLLHQVYGAALADNLGYSCALAGDVNGDRFGDFVVGARLFDAGGLQDSGSVLVFSGFDTSLLFRTDGVAVQDNTGRSVAGGRDLDGDGFHEIIYGAPFADPFGNTLAGLVEVKRLVPALATTATTVSSGAGGLVDFHINFPPSEAGYGYLLLASFSGLGPTTAFGVTIPLTSDSLMSLMHTGAPAIFTNASGILDASGDATAQLNMPPGTASGLVGTTFYFAAVSASSATSPRLASNAVALLLEP